MVAGQNLRNPGGKGRKFLLLFRRQHQMDKRLNLPAQGLGRYNGPVSLDNAPLLHPFHPGRL